MSTTKPVLLHHYCYFLSSEVLSLHFAGFQRFCQSSALNQQQRAIACCQTLVLSFDEHPVLYHHQVLVYGYRFHLETRRWNSLSPVDSNDIGFDSAQKSRRHDLLQTVKSSSDYLSSTDKTGRFWRTTFPKVMQLFVCFVTDVDAVAHGRVAAGIGGVDGAIGASALVSVEAMDCLRLSKQVSHILEKSMLLLHSFKETNNHWLTDVTI